MDPVTAAAEVALPFLRTGVTSLPAKKPAKAKIAVSSSHIEAAVAEIKQVPEQAAKHEAPAAASVEGREDPSVLAAPLEQLIMTSPFGHRVSPVTGVAGELHTGTDFAEECGTPVFGSAAGTVVEAEWHAGGGGNRVVIDHGNGLETTYNHLAKFNVKVGQQLAGGARIAAVGTTGASTGCHLHFEVMVNGQVTDPAGWLSF